MKHKKYCSDCGILKIKVDKFYYGRVQYNSSTGKVLKEEICNNLECPRGRTDNSILRRNKCVEHDTGLNRNFFITMLLFWKDDSKCKKCGELTDVAEGASWF